MDIQPFDPQTMAGSVVATVVGLLLWEGLRQVHQRGHLWLQRRTHFALRLPIGLAQLQPWAVDQRDERALLLDANGTVTLRLSAPSPWSGQLLEARIVRRRIAWLPVWLPGNERLLSIREGQVVSSEHGDPDDLFSIESGGELNQQAGAIRLKLDSDLVVQAFHGMEISLDYVLGSMTKAGEFRVGVYREGTWWMAYIPFTKRAEKGKAEPL